MMLPSPALTAADDVDRESYYGASEQRAPKRLGSKVEGQAPVINKAMTIDGPSGLLAPNHKS